MADYMYAKFSLATGSHFI